MLYGIPPFNPAMCDMTHLYVRHSWWQTDTSLCFRSDLGTQLRLHQSRLAEGKVSISPSLPPPSLSLAGLFLFLTFPFSVFLSLSLFLSRSLSLSLPPSPSVSVCLFLAFSRARSCALSRSLALTLQLTNTLPVVGSLVRSISLSCAHSLSLSLSLARARALFLSLFCARALSLSSLSLPRFPFSFPSTLDAFSLERAHTCAHSLPGCSYCVGSVNYHVSFANKPYNTSVFFLRRFVESFLPKSPALLRKTRRNLATYELRAQSSVNPKSTSNQSSKPCTVLQYPSTKGIL